VSRPHLPRSSSPSSSCVHSPSSSSSPSSWAMLAWRTVDCSAGMCEAFMCGLEDPRPMGHWTVPLLLDARCSLRSDRLLDSSNLSDTAEIRQRVHGHTIRESRVSFSQIGQNRNAVRLLLTERMIRLRALVAQTVGMK